MRFVNGHDSLCSHTSYYIYKRHAMLSLPHPLPTRSRAPQRPFFTVPDALHIKSRNPLRSRFSHSCLFGPNLADLFALIFPNKQLPEAPSQARPAKHLQYDPSVSDLQSTMSARCFVHVQSGTMPPSCLIQAACRQPACREIRPPSMSHALSGCHNKEKATFSVSFHPM